MKRLICLGIALFLNLYLLPMYAQGAGKFVTAEGMAPIGEDESLTRDLAILRAKQAALETMGIGLKSSTIVDRGMLLDDVIKIQTFGLIKAYTVLSEGRDGDRYKVRIQAWVVSKTEEKPTLKNLFASRSLLLKASGVGSRIIEKKLLRKLTKGGYFVLDPSISKWVPDYTIDAHSAARFSQENYGMRSYYADCEIRLQKTSDGRILVSETSPDDNIIFGVDENQAMSGNGPNSFSRKIAEPLIEEFARRFDQIAHVQEHDVKVVVHGIHDHRMFRQDFLRMLRAIQLGVKDVFDERFSDDLGQATVRYSEKTDYLGAMIGFRSRYKINKSTWDRIDVTYQGS